MTQHLNSLFIWDAFHCFHIIFAGKIDLHRAEIYISKLIVSFFALNFATLVRQLNIVDLDVFCFYLKISHISLSCVAWYELHGEGNWDLINLSILSLEYLKCSYELNKYLSVAKPNSDDLIINLKPQKFVTGNPKLNNFNYTF